MANSMDLEGARTLVLGGSGVLGGSIASALKERGATVMLAGRDPARLRDRASSLGPEVGSVVFDLRVPEDARRVVDEAVSRLGGLDGLVDAAGIVAFGGLDELTDETLDELIAVDLTGPLRVIRAALPHLDGGFVVNITGLVAETPVAGMAAYSAVKAGLSAATTALGRELRRRRIHLLDARPPHTETGLASRPIAGTAPPMPEGLSPAHVAHVIVAGLVERRRELPAEAFAPS